MHTRISGVSCMPRRGKRKAGRVTGRMRVPLDMSAVTGNGIRRCEQIWRDVRRWWKSIRWLRCGSGSRWRSFSPPMSRRFAVLADHEDEMYFDANGRKLAADTISGLTARPRSTGNSSSSTWRIQRRTRHRMDTRRRSTRRTGSPSTGRRMRCSVSGCGRRRRRVTCGETDAGGGRAENEPHAVSVHDVRAGGSAGAGGAGEVP